MALSLDSIYKPLRDFFLNHFKTDDGSPVFFRFDKFGSVISDNDFKDPHSPGQYSVALAREKFSALVNNVPIEDADGQSIYFSQTNFDDTYHDRLLSPSIPFIPKDSNESTRESIMQSFSNIKADAIKIWDSIELESSTGLMFKFKPSLAHPEDWYDKTNDNLWTTFSVDIDQTEIMTPADNTAKFQLWKLKADDATLQRALLLREKHAIAKPFEPIIAIKKTKIPQVNSVLFNNIPLPQSALAILQPSIHLLIGANNKTFYIHTNYLQKLTSLAIKIRIAVMQFLKLNAPTRPVKTKTFSISFKYTLVSIDRPWYHGSFIDNKSWFIPGTTKAQLTQNNEIGNVSILPIAFVAIKNLNIEANWTNEDIALSKKATDFGPFEVSSEIKNNKLSHEGLQIIGWVIQKMPELAPNSDPNLI